MYIIVGKHQAWWNNQYILTLFQCPNQLQLRCIKHFCPPCYLIKLSRFSRATTQGPSEMEINLITVILISRGHSICVFSHNFPQCVSTDQNIHVVNVASQIPYAVYSKLRESPLKNNSITESLHANKCWRWKRANTKAHMFHVAGAHRMTIAPATCGFCWVFTAAKRNEPCLSGGGRHIYTENSE